ncbi:NAD dependent epimerase/dehydratase [Penicillium taxi]|uniref:NAD dependent epimerase/dehydratase n=1 Tax=Penicillium taxi TaxID=168475 RepID=UPI002545A7C9|nr:NAD dependent epimerase/dehydratase [Penicillium taxi]KAJ5893370.1 NAD dependent epimerase/dehydratase [Penicillium taxi]
MSLPIVFVCGATGTQGGALAHHLLEQDVEVHTITRDLNSVSAQNLQQRGVHITEGNFDDEEIMKKSMANCTTLFLNLTPNHSIPTGELEQAKRLISIAKQVAVKHIIYTSTVVSRDPERLRYWNPDSYLGMSILLKQSIENEVRDSGFDAWTILRPGNFMSNFLNPLVKLLYHNFVETGNLVTAFTNETIIPMIDPNDIGKFAAAAALDQAKFNNKEIEIVSQMMTLEEVMRDLSLATGKVKQATFLSEEEVEKLALLDPMVQVQRAMRDMS